MQSCKFLHLSDSVPHWNPCLRHSHNDIEMFYRKVLNLSWSFHNNGRFLMMDTICLQPEVQCHFLCFSPSVLFWIRKTSAKQLLLKDVCSSSSPIHLSLQSLYKMVWFLRSLRLSYWCNPYGYCLFYVKFLYLKFLFLYIRSLSGLSFL